ncbi:MAG: hypothetical protein A2826_00210 [Candidatus Doudnabacteria bacterium RIFCSPHIGHO2_01_FULL_43_23]|uniref:EfeO-type cupredoxin-like domain-containing protein n=1 Tax=Candidatus Doudnabacteria bacterium RIFCSPHIGHO2_01_FULL_43_23 TaxID=1817822 RepID=A0A1F5NTC8_9BACT|nr:MAG: hypothetical protein A2826_00210 [Candidatus Doudnabacteria bacterium RIFCSPHIGHO2_01_FULL_43_23]
MKKNIITIVIIVAIAIVVYVVSTQYNSKNSNSDSEENSEEMTQKVPGYEDDVDEMIVDTGASDDDAISEAEDQPIEDVTDVEELSKSVTVVFTGQAYSPDIVNIKVGDSVLWRNESDSKSTWPASAVHPTHNVYPTTGGCLGSTLDACRELGKGETFSFTFEEVGAWKMHDHLNPGVFMTVVVTQ